MLSEIRAALFRRASGSVKGWFMSRNTNNSKGCGSWLQWLVGILIALLAAGGGIVALLGYINQPPPAPTPVVCSLSGTIYNNDNNQSLPNIQVSYFRITQDPSDYTHGVRSQLATTDTNGHFDADCSAVEPENFPLRLQLFGSGWCSIYQTNEYVQLGQRRTNINLYVSEHTLKNLGCH
jgi:hypothetical protein